LSDLKRLAARFLTMNDEEIEKALAEGELTEATDDGKDEEQLS
jgi:hypothetical protein